MVTPSFSFAGSVSNSAFPIMVHCHLRWDGVWQRPQQFLSRLAKKHRVLFVEGPIVHEELDGQTLFTPFFTVREAAETPNVWILNTHFPVARFDDGAFVDAERTRLLDEALRTTLKGKFNRPVQWIYDPMAVDSHAGKHGEIACVYDCMDELSQFKFAPPELVARERRLLNKADVVFAGGRKMWESKSRFNSNCHFYGCGVDVKHFGQARLETCEVPEDIRAFAASGPVLGYFGVVDERLDYELIEKLADANPDWNIVMVGPVCKVDPAEFPQRPNLHWLGGRPYAQLPAYTKAFDVCLMPFALNEATEFINPTKALEYMATATPIVSTAVPDVVSNFHRVVKIGTPEQFLKLCHEQAYQPDQLAVERGVKMANENTWDAIVAKLEGHIEDVLRGRSIQPAAMPRAYSVPGTYAVAAAEAVASAA